MCGNKGTCANLFPKKWTPLVKGTAEIVKKTIRHHCGLITCILLNEEIDPCRFSRTCNEQYNNISKLPLNENQRQINFHESARAGDMLEEISEVVKAIEVFLTTLPKKARPTGRIGGRLLAS